MLPDMAQLPTSVVVLWTAFAIGVLVVVTLLNKKG